eukprot:XP_011682474.1 PREDICTED: organic cation transporter protein [Strongylocentrotus purpuratus]
MKFDAILGEIGEFGLYQKLVYYALCINGATVACHMLAQVFLAGHMSHSCKVSAWDNEDCSRWDYTAEQCMEAKHNASVPFNYTKEDNMFQCYKYGIVDELDFHPGLDPENYNNTDLIRCNQGWVYDKSQYKSSIISEFDLVCSHKDRDSLAQSLFFVGVLIGSVVFGGLSDIYGRRKILFVALLVQSVSGLAIAFSPSYWFYTIFRMILASANMGVFLLSFIIGTEFVGPSKRVIAGIVIMIFFSIGYMLLALFAYFIREWWILQLAITAPIFIMFAFFPFLPESVRWLISKGRTEEATRIIKKAADVNKAKLPEPIFTPEDIKEQVTNTMKRYEPRQFLFYNGYTNGKLNDEISHLFLAIGAWRTTVAMIGKFGISASFAIVYIYSAELFPTPVSLIILANIVIVMEEAMLKETSMSARIAGILAPIIPLLDDTWEPFPVLIFGVMSIAAGLLVLFLPETRGEQLPETLEEGEMFGTKPKEYEVKTEPRFQYKNDANSGVINQAFDQEIEQGKVIS